MFLSVGKASVDPAASCTFPPVLELGRESGRLPGLVQERVAFSTKMANLLSFLCCRHDSGFWIIRIFWKSQTPDGQSQTTRAQAWLLWYIKSWGKPPRRAVTFRRLIETAASAIVFTVWGRSARQNLMALKMAMVVKAWRRNKNCEIHMAVCVWGGGCSCCCYILSTKIFIHLAKWGHYWQVGAGFMV